jgi:uncharacterized protein DUF6915
MKPYLHALVSVKKWGGVPEDTLPIHDFLDSSKQSFADMRHRAILHSSFGCYIVERVFGHNLTLSTGKLVSTRDVAEQHILDDMGRIPSLDDYLRGMPFYDWLGGLPRKTRTVTLPDSGTGLAGLEKLVID